MSPAPEGAMHRLLDILLFRRMLAPILLQVFFWAAIAGTCYGAWWLWSHGIWAWWLALIFGTLMSRLIFEFGIIAFRSYEALTAIRDSLATRD